MGLEHATYSALEAELVAAAKITPRDMAAAQGFWRYWSTPLLRALLGAKRSGWSLLDMRLHLSQTHARAILHHN